MACYIRQWLYNLLYTVNLINKTQSYQLVFLTKKETIQDLNKFEWKEKWRKKLYNMGYYLLLHKINAQWATMEKN